MLLWKSKNAFEWEFAGVFWQLPSVYLNITHGSGAWRNNRFDCPDSWELPDGRQVVSVLGSMYGIGNFDRQFRKFSPELVGVGGCGPQQSMWDDKGRRIQICSRGLALPRANYSGHQSLPHEVKLSDDGTQLVFSHLPELLSLHGEYRNFTAALSLANGSRTLVEASDRFGLNMHVRVVITMATPCGASASWTLVKGAVLFGVHCDATVAVIAIHSDGSGSLIKDANHIIDETKEATKIFQPATTLSKDGTSSTASIEAFIDGALTDIILNNGEVGPSFAVAANDTGVLPVPAGNQPPDWAPKGTGVEIGVSAGGEAVFKVELWKMERGVDPCEGELKSHVQGSHV